MDVPLVLSYASHVSSPANRLRRTLTLVPLLCLTACWEGPPDAPAGTTPEASDAATDPIESDADLEAAPDTQEVPEPFDFDGQRMWDDVLELASEAYDGRMPGTPGGELALTFVEKHFGAMGLTPLGTNGFRKRFSFDMWLQQGPSVLEVEGDPWVERQDFGLLMGSGAGQVEGALVFAGYGLTVPPFDQASYPTCPLSMEGYDDYAGLDVDGKIVLVFRHGPGGDDAVHEGCPANTAAKTFTKALWNFGYKAANAALHGAAGVLMVNRFGTPESTPIQGTVGPEYHDPQVIVGSVHRQKIEAVLPDLATWQSTIDESLAPASVATGLQLVLEAQAGVEARETDNLLASFPGTDPELSKEAVVFGAHIDHLGIDPVTGELFAGADDNASGTSVLMELARALRAGLIEPKRTVVLASFNAEEQGLIGSCEYVRRPSHPIAKTTAMFSLDMVGVGDGAGVVLYGADGKTFPDLGELMRTSAEASGVTGTVVQGPALDASDHYCFALAGVPAVLVTSSGLHGTYHTPKDTADKISPSILETTARLSWATLGALVMD